MAEFVRDGGTREKFLEMVAAAPEWTLEAAAASQTGGKPNEADDDPHRLARVNLQSYSSANHGRTLRFWRDEWYTWRDNAYHTIGKNELQAKLTAAIKREFDRINLEKTASYNQSKLAGLIAPEKDKGPPTCAKVTPALVSSVLQATASMVTISSSIELNTWLPTRKPCSYISLTNGILNLEKVLSSRPQDSSNPADYLIPHSPDWFSLTSLPYAFDPVAPCPIFNAFLEHNLELDPERIKLVQEWAGYCLLPTTDEQKFMMMEGSGRNGKSVYIAALTAMLGENNVSAVPLENFGTPFDKTSTLGMLLNACGDCGEIDKVAEGHIKAFTSGDRMFFNRKNMPGTTCKPTARLLINCNERPRFKDRSDGIWRRLILVPWRVRITDDKVVRGMDKTAFWQASGELPGIFRWALVGLARLRSQRGFTRSSIAEQAGDEYREESNPAQCFLAEHVEKAESFGIIKPLLYRLYRRWALENGYHPLAAGAFGKEVKKCFPEIESRYRGPKVSRFHIHKGIRFIGDKICGEQTENYSEF